MEVFARKHVCFYTDNLYRYETQRDTEIRRVREIETETQTETEADFISLTQMKTQTRIQKNSHPQGNNYNCPKDFKATGGPLPFAQGHPRTPLRASGGRPTSNALET